MLALTALVAALASPAPATPTPSPQRLLGLIRARFLAHRPPPPFVTYTLSRKQMATNGYPDLAETYTEHIWCRTSDRAALARRVYRDDARGDLTFERPAFNEDRDPGPPTADVFEPAPAHPRPVEVAPTPEAMQTPLPVIGGVQTFVEFDYTVASVTPDGELLDVRIEPKRDPDRNRLRELWVDKRTYELRKIVATDRLFVDGEKHVYPATATVTMGTLDGVPVVTAVDAVVGGGYSDDGKEVHFTLTDIAFPKTLPDWYFNARTYARHQADAPS